MIKNMISALLGGRRESVKDLERGTGLSYPTCYGLYAGQTKMITFDAMSRLCAYFDCQPCDLFVYLPDKEPVSTGASE